MNALQAGPNAPPQPLDSPVIDPYKEHWTIIAKISGRCDLRCKGCYEEFDKPQGIWTLLPPIMDKPIAQGLAGWLIQARVENPNLAFDFVLHGGEPLIVGEERMKAILDEYGGLAESIRVQTNGTFMDEAFADLFEERGVRVGLSLDGDREANDMVRVGPSGKSSYDTTVHAADLLRRRGLLDRILWVVNLDANPERVVRALAELNPPLIDFNLPHATWDNPPKGTEDRTPDNISSTDPKYARYLLRVLAEHDRLGGNPPIRYFDSITNGFLGGPSFVETIGIGPVRELVIRTDGTIEGVDMANVAGPEAVKTGMSIASHSFKEVTGHPLIASRVMGREALKAQLPTACQACPFVDPCGGMAKTYRHSSVYGEDIPPVYCADSIELMSHFAGRLVAASSKATAKKLLSQGHAH